MCMFNNDPHSYVLHFDFPLGVTRFSYLVWSLQVLKKLDLDKDHRVSKEDFAESVKKDKLLLEVFGPCLPETKVYWGVSFLTENWVRDFAKSAHSTINQVHLRHSPLPIYSMGIFMPL